MTQRRHMVIGLSSTVLLVAVWSGGFAYVGDDPVITTQSCSFTTATAEFGPDGSIRYNVMGTCNGSPITGEMGYGTDQRMKERFFYGGAQIRTSAICPADPWISGVACEDQKVSATGANPGPLLYSRVPLSTSVVGAAQVFQNAHANASHPKPPGPPVNVKAIMRFTLSNQIERAVVSWLGPDQQGSFGPYLDFIVEARPQKAEGAAWVKLNGIRRHAAPGYQVIVQFPPAPQGTTGWEVRTCSATVFTRTCTGPLIPAPAILADRIDRLAPGSRLGLLPPGKTTIDPQQLPAKPFSAPMQGGSSAAGKAALNPQPLPPKVASPSVPRIPSAAGKAALNSQPLPPKAFSDSIQSRPSLGGNAALNPQPLPPKALSVQPVPPRSFRFGSIMQRGVPEGDAPRAEVAPDSDPSTKMPPADEKPAP